MTRPLLKSCLVSQVVGTDLVRSNPVLNPECLLTHGPHASGFAHNRPPSSNLASTFDTNSLGTTSNLGSIILASLEFKTPQVLVSASKSALCAKSYVFPLVIALPYASYDGGHKVFSTDSYCRAQVHLQTGQCVSIPRCLRRLHAKSSRETKSVQHFGAFFPPILRRDCGGVLTHSVGSRQTISGEHGLDGAGV